jgi:cytochrome c-type biogenesis protein CcmH/NrfG
MNHPRAIAWLILLAIALSGCESFGKRSNASSTPPASVDLTQLDKDAAAAYAAQDWATSERLYVDLTKATPSATEPWFRLGNIYARTGRVEMAIKAYRETVIRDSKHARAWHNMGVVQLRQAAGSFAELAKYGAPEDPLVQRGAALGIKIEQLLAPAIENAGP